MGLLSGSEDFFFRGVQASAADVFGDGLVEDHYVLADEGEQFAAVFDFELAQVFSVEEDGACGRVKEPEEKVDERGFARPAFTSNAQFLTMRSFSMLFCLLNPPPAAGYLLFLIFKHSVASIVFCPAAYLGGNRMAEVRLRRQDRHLPLLLDFYYVIKLR